MLFFVCKCAEFVLDGGAVAGTDALDRAVEKGRQCESAAQDLVHFGGRVDRKTGKLFFNRLCFR